MKEYEIKLLGEQASLSTIFRQFMRTPSIRDRNYAFNTYYFDDNDRYYFGGFSLRHRTGVLEINKAAGTELKALEGEIGNVSARLELQVLGECPLENAKRLEQLPQYPNNAPSVSPDRLKIQFATSVRRVERRAVVPLNGKEYVIEAALDDIAYLRNEGYTGNGLFDCVLMPVKIEHELELELKGGNDEVLPYFFEWVRLNCIQHTATELTTRSKALRGRAVC